MKPCASLVTPYLTTAGWPSLHRNSYTVARPVAAAGITSALVLFWQNASISAVGTCEVPARSWQGRFAPKWQTYTSPSMQRHTALS